MRFKKGILLGAVAAAMIGVGAEAKQPDLSFYDDLANKVAPITVVDSCDLTTEMLTERDGKLVIEKCLGEVVSSDGDGKILNPADPDYDYISYKSVADINKGDIILTYYIYNPENNSVDDILYRFDYVLDDK